MAQIGEEKRTIIVEPIPENVPESVPVEPERSTEVPDRIEVPA